MIAETLLRIVNRHKGPIKMRVHNSVYSDMIVDVDKKSAVQEILHITGNNALEECGLEVLKEHDGSLYLRDDDSVWRRDNRWTG